MTRNLSTFRAADDATWSDPPTEQRRLSLPNVIKAEWVRNGRPDLVESINQHPQILRDRSVLLTLAIDEYKERGKAKSDFDLHDYCQRFHRFGSSIERSILRQLETQRYLDAHPELLALFGEPMWPESGDDFGDFRVREELGRGAIARVYLCRQSDVGNRAVVVKAAPFSSAEAAVLGRLNHPNIIPIHSIGEVQERSLNYLCMPFCGRSTLVDVLELVFAAAAPSQRQSVILEAARRWTTREDRIAHNGHVPPNCRAACGTYVGGVVALAVEIAAALDHAHQHQILHGDIKPSNVLLTPEGRPMLVDFNLSVDYANSVGLCGGTLPYMPPEHLEQLLTSGATLAPAAQFDPRPDIYSFGALVYELLTGTPPVKVTTSSDNPTAAAESALEQLRGGIASLRAYNPLVSPRLEKKLLRCLAFKPEDRPATMAQVQADLEKELSLAPAATRLVRSEPRKFAAILAVAVAFSGIVGAYWATRPPRHVVQFARGQQAYAAGDFAAAVDHYAAAADAAPDLAPARFELARARLAAGDIDLAIKDFQQLAQQHDDPHSMAYLGYCFNLKDVPAAAIAWHERALEKRFDTVAANNNLGASYLVAPGKLSETDRFARAELLLRNAHELDTSSIFVTLNLIRLELAKSSRDPAYSPITAWHDVQTLLSAERPDDTTNSTIQRWYELVKDRPRPADNAVIATLEKIENDSFFSARSNSDRSLHTRAYYIEPTARMAPRR